VADQIQEKTSRTRARIVFAVLGVVVILLVIGGIASSSPALCGSCHEMESHYETWAVSAHSGVKCVSCHETPREWYGQPLRAVERVRRLARDTWDHLAGRFGGLDEPSAVGQVSPIADEVCLQCHSPNRKATSGFRILIDHAAHAERTGSCVACHVYTAHPDPVLGRPLSLMVRCYQCHGTAEQPEASDDCATCHPSDFDLRPASHLEDPWMRDHGFSAANNREVCTMCHEQSYCDGCHVVEMPHPEGWLEGPRGHGEAAATLDREVCYRCHAKEPDSCAACHHESYDPAKGTWLEQHYDEARTAGVVTCLECHEPLSCSRCHKAPAGVSE
jgi:nitrate/TMAO reductase-like tetraheme cytochrome c subunit